MKKIIHILIVIFLPALNLSAQVGIGTTTPNPSAVLDVYSPDFGLLIPRINTDRRLQMAPVNGMMVYDVDYKQFYVYENDVWTSMGTGDPTWVRSTALSQTYLANQNDIVGLGTYSPVASAKLDIRSTTKGLMIPKMTQTQMTLIASPAVGLLVFNSTANSFYYYNGSAWTMLLASSAGMLKDTDSDTKIEVEKNADEDIIRFTLAGSEKMTLIGNRLEMPKTGTQNLFIGMWAGKANTTGYLNTALGDSSLRYNTTGYYNTAAGHGSLWQNNTGTRNTAFGMNSLTFNATGNRNCAFGALSLSQNTEGSFNTAMGYAALNSNTSSMNTAVGNNALSSNSTGTSNTAMGHEALYVSNGSFNIALGSTALHENSSGSRNVAIGNAALYNNLEFHNLIAIGDSAQFSTGIDPDYHDLGGNIAIGNGSLRNNTRGTAAIAMGRGSLYHNMKANNVIAIGDSALFNNDINTSQSANAGNDNIAIGNKALHNNIVGEENIAIGSMALFNNGSPCLCSFESSANIAIGYQALYENQIGRGNIAIGSRAFSMTYGSANRNIAIGEFALASLDSAAIDSQQPNVAIGSFALMGRSDWQPITHDHYGNVAIGHMAMTGVISGSQNSGVGFLSLSNISSGWGNSALGYLSGTNNTTGSYNVAVGDSALINNESGNKNIAIGYQALGSNSTHTDLEANVAIGCKAGEKVSTGYGNTLIGEETGNSITTGYDNTWIGKSISNSGLPGINNSIALGNSTPIDANNKARIGNTSVSSIGGQVNWTAFSDGRFKMDIREDVPGLNFITLLKPVTFTVDIKALNEHYNIPSDENSNTETGSIRYTGFIAQDVEASARYLGYDFSGVDKSSETLGLRYAEFVVPLVKAVQEQQAMIEQLQEENRSLRIMVEEMKSSMTD